MPTKTKVVINIMDDTDIDVAVGAVWITTANGPLGQVPTRDITQMVGHDTIHLDHIPSAKIERFDVWRFTGDNG